MTRPIKQGDKVSVLWTFPTVGDSSRQGTVLHTPQDSGDMWYIKTDGLDRVLAINPQNLYLHSIMLEEEV